MTKEGRCPICGDPAVRSGYCDFHAQKQSDRAKKRNSKHKEDGSRLIKSYIEETHAAGKPFVIREDEQGRCYVSFVQNWEGRIFYDDLVMIYKTNSLRYIDGWEETAKKICDLLNEE